MNSFYRRLSAFIAGLLMAGLAAPLALADDTEIFYGQATANSAPNVMFVFDTSGSMGTQVATTEPYDPNQTYNGSGLCGGLSNRVFYTTGNSTTPPNCNSANYVPAANFKCAASQADLFDSHASGRYVDFAIRYGRVRKIGNTIYYDWQTAMNVANSSDVECLLDNGVDGNNSNNSPYPRVMGTANTLSAAQWTATANKSYWVAGVRQQYTFFNSNYVIWYSQYRNIIIGTRLSILQQAASDMLNSLHGVNVGLMRYSNNGGSGGGGGGCSDSSAQGGMVVYPAGPIESNRANLIATVNGYTANGCTPLSETLWEAYQYYSGGAVDYGNNSSPSKSVASSRSPATATGANYNSPADFACQKNYVVYLTDGLPTADTDATPKIQGLDLASVSATCRANSPTDTGGTTQDGICLRALAKYMFSKDLRSDVPAEQNVTSYFIGFGSDFSGGSGLSAAYDYLDEAATAGGGKAYQAGALGDLSAALADILTQVADQSASFTAPTVAVNAFNRTQSLDSVYISLFKPSLTWHWQGNLKKYRILNGTIVDSTSVPAVDTALGTFKDSSQSYWSTAVDGNNVDKGGAASHIPSPASSGGRNVFTWLGGTNAGGSPVPLADATHNFVQTNSAITDAMLGTDPLATSTIGADGPTGPTRAKLIDWARGADVNVGTGTAARLEMGDTLHSQPAVVIYGGTPSSPDITDSAIFAATNDGYLHAVDVSTGAELWSFIPYESLGNLINLYNNDSASSKHYELDGNIQVIKFDTNNDGIVDSANTAGGHDRVVLLFSSGRGGDLYYALDVTDKNNPAYMWSLSSAELPGLGQAWSSPVVSRVNISGASQNSQQLAMFIGGGYDPAEDGTDITGTYLAADAVGNRLFVVDAIRGTLLWSGGPTSSGTTQTFGTRMDHAIPASPEVVDLDGDGYADRLYVGDLAGQVWRFDIWNGSAASSLMTGGVIASLGTHDDGTHLPANSRRFYSSPDTARIATPTTPLFMSVAIGSGYRGHPLNTSIQDSFYVLRDTQPLTKMTQAQYNSYAILHDSDVTLVDITGNATPVIPAGSTGWKMRLNQNGGWVGEKSLSRAVTFGGTVIFTTYTPQASSLPCVPALGVNRAYFVSALDGRPTVDLNHDGTVNNGDVSMTINQAGIAAEPRVLTSIVDSDSTCTVNPQDPSCTAGNSNGNGGGNNANSCIVLNGTAATACPPVKTFIKTYWREGGAN